MSTEPDANVELYRNPAYLYGHIVALRSLVLTLAGITAEKEEFVPRALQALARARTALEPQPVSEAALMGIESTERWLLHATAED